MYEELCRADLQVRVQDVHEILREEVVKPGLPGIGSAMKKLTNMLAAMALASIPVGHSAVAAKDLLAIRPQSKTARRRPRRTEPKRARAL